MLQSQLGALWIGAEVSDIVKEHVFARSKVNICRKLIHDRVKQFFVIIPLLANYLSTVKLVVTMIFYYFISEI